ncbi:MAG: response regulator, partial [Verrucomicrobiota bacterium]
KWNLQSINHELEKANQTISQEDEKQDQMISWISHDIRTPLQSILNLLCSSRMQNSEEREEILSSIHSSGKMMQRMVNGLLHLSSQQPDSSNPKNEAIQIETYIDELRQILLPLALEKKLELSGSYIGPADLTIEAAREYLDQITINLLTNSIKYTEAGKIDFRIEATRNAKNKINLTFIVENKSLVDDKDINLPEPILSAAYPVTTDSFGFGLRIAQKAADKLKGNLLVEHSKNSCSAIFKFTAMTKLGQDSHSLVMIDRPDTELTIAWIDDERLNTLVGRTLFEELGIRTVLYYNSGKDAFAELQSIRCDYIFIDLVMPGWDGYQTFKMLSPLDTCTQSKWVAMSAHHTRKEIRHAYLMGYDQFLAKPFNKSDLAQTLNMIITVPQHLKKTEQSYRDAALIISQDLPEAIETLRKGLQLQDRECIRTSSHKLKGISGILQLNDYYALFEKMEKSPSGFGEQELDDMNSKFSKLENSVLLFSNSMNSVFG